MFVNAVKAPNRFSRSRMRRNGRAGVRIPAAAIALASVSINPCPVIAGFVPAIPIEKAYHMPLGITGSRRAMRGGPVMTPAASILRRSLALVALRPLGEDAIAVLRHPGEVVLHHRLLGLRRIIRRKVLDGRIGHERVVFRIQLARALARAPVGDFLGGLE